MYKIEKTGYGFRLTFGDFISLEEMKRWAEESKKALVPVLPGFFVFVDMRTLKPMDQETQKVMGETQHLYKAKGMKRSVVILNDFLIKNQFKRIAKDSGIYEWERYIDAVTNPNWEKDGLAWIQKGIDPDLEAAA